MYRILFIIIFLSGCASNPIVIPDKEYKILIKDFDSKIAQIEDEKEKGSITDEEASVLIKEENEDLNSSIKSAREGGISKEDLSKGFDKYGKPILLVLLFCGIVAGIFFGIKYSEPISGSPIQNLHPCNCPNDVAADGSLCGLRSAYSRSNGRSPSCY